MPISLSQGTMPGFVRLVLFHGRPPQIMLRIIGRTTIAVRDYMQC